MAAFAMLVATVLGYVANILLLAQDMANAEFNCI